MTPFAADEEKANLLGHVPALFFCFNVTRGAENTDAFKGKSGAHGSIFIREDVEKTTPVVHL